MCWTFSKDEGTFSYQEILIIDAKPLPEVSKHQGAILLELEMAGHVFSAQGKQETTVRK